MVGDLATLPGLDIFPDGQFFVFAFRVYVEPD
jgi:hypothetical protein